MFYLSKHINARKQCVEPQISRSLLLATGWRIQCVMVCFWAPYCLLYCSWCHVFQKKTASSWFFLSLVFQVVSMVFQVFYSPNPLLWSCMLLFCVIVQKKDFSQSNNWFKYFFLLPHSNWSQMSFISLSSALFLVYLLTWSLFMVLFVQTALYFYDPWLFH